MLYQLSYAPITGSTKRNHPCRPSPRIVCLPTSTRKRCDLQALFIQIPIPCGTGTIDHIPTPLSREGILLRKEVIQPQVPLRLPCYDFIPITTHTLGAFPPCGLEQRRRVQTAFMM